jgi:hypothetical protein
VAVGYGAGRSTQGHSAVAIGYSAAIQSQRSGAIAIGSLAGNTGQGTNAIAIGTNAGLTGQGANSIVIGSNAGGPLITPQPANSITINALGTVVTSALANAFYVAPIRGVATATPVLVYNTTTNEITYNTSSIKYKKNVIDLQEDTSKLYNIKAREYDTKDDDKHFIGYIAEELNDVDTYFTWKNPDGTPEGIEWFNLLIYTIEEMKKLKQEIASLTATVTSLQNNK